MVIALSLALVMYLTENANAKSSLVGKSGTVKEAKLRLDDILDVLTDKDSKKGAETDSKEKSEKEKRQEKQRSILEGIGSILASSGEIDYESERTIGESLALEGFHRYGMPVDNQPLQKYVNLVGHAVARNSLRPGIPYRFVVVKSSLQNAFSCPGGIIFLSSELLNTLETEAQLACILAHEVAHVGHKHALKSIQRARFFQGVGKITAATMKGEKGEQFGAMIQDLESILFERGLDQNMEFEADLTGMETAYRTGYNPNGMVEVLTALKRLEAGSQKKGSWFSTHPPLNQRIQKCKDQLGYYQDRENMAQLPGRFSSYKKITP